jgi:hypothetical protein
MDVGMQPAQANGGVTIKAFHGDNTIPRIEKAVKHLNQKPPADHTGSLCHLTEAMTEIRARLTG